MRQSQSRSFAETNKIKLLEVWEWFIIENKSGKLKNNWLSTEQYALENKKLRSYYDILKSKTSRQKLLSFNKTGEIRKIV